uniref:Ribosome assembly factor mrt4 n=1 Tax=Timspurckia oligopyrenoides TaxID=708627 RepID=A0A7S1ETJ0_9RHOD|mmetsp:Transcript_6559/g.11720  ORF Transcript_6559/g.11720 Transcript_6559/m.11720 type:complete len:226 (+) Transcript_6559:70-747(+)
MPRSKRQRIVSLSKTGKHVIGREGKHGLIEEIRECVDKYDSIYVFSYQDMRNAKLKELRVEWRDSRFFLGRNKLLQVALGKDAATEHAENLNLVAKRLSGDVGLLFTNREHTQVKEFFESYSASDFARSGARAIETVTLNAGALTQFVASQNDQLQALGMPVQLSKGVIELMGDFTVCEMNEILTPEKAKILELLGYKHAQFKLNLLAHWSKNKGFETLSYVGMK